MNIPTLPGIDRLELLETFVRIIEAGSLSQAALLLQTSQPTVSRRLQQLERMLGLRLIQRTTHSMKLTEDGARCFEHAKDLLERWAMAEADLHGLKESPRGTLRVLMPHAFGQDQMIAPLVTFLSRYPDISVEWLLHDRLPDFIAEGIDCAVRVGRVDDPGLVAIPLAEVPRLVVAAPSLLQGRPLPQHARELEALPWIAIRTFYHDEVALECADSDQTHRFTIRPRLGTDSLYALRSAALAGVGACITSAWIVTDDLAAGRLVHVAPQWRAPALPVYMVYPYARFYPARLRAFVALMREQVPGLTGMTARRELAQTPSDQTL
jgi:DNA-binding transcriptional LysR family regulator